MEDPLVLSQSGTPSAVQPFPAVDKFGGVPIGMRRPFAQDGQ